MDWTKVSGEHRPCWVVGSKDSEEGALGDVMSLPTASRSPWE